MKGTLDAEGFEICAVGFGTPWSSNLVDGIVTELDPIVNVVDFKVTAFESFVDAIAISEPEMLPARLAIGVVVILR